ncbi:MAG: ADP-ribosylglycohydrolase family protein [Gemmatimonadota bacterium]
MPHGPDPATLRDRAQGCLLGLAIGDAMGAPAEFKSPGDFVPITGFRSGGWFGLQAGQWTDDSSMAICLAESLLSRGGLHLADNLERFCRWYQEGENSSTGHCFDIGVGTRGALNHWLATGEVNAGDRTSGGNGALMRLAPVAIFFHSAPREAGAKAREMTVTTHGAPEALDASRWFGETLARALLGEDPATLVPAPGWEGHPAVARVVTGSWRTQDESLIRADGYCIPSLEAALWAFDTTSSFRDCILKAVNLGDDADTVGAIAGQVAGAVYGRSGIPEEWITGLQESERFVELADGLVEAGGVGGRSG